MFRSWQSKEPWSNVRVFSIIDDDFVATIETSKYLFDVIIEEYEKRGLPVAANLMKAFVEYSRIMGSDVDDVINRVSINEANPRCKDYREEMKRYLLLL